jgi:hypothetical protein
VVDFPRGTFVAAAGGMGNGRWLAAPMKIGSAEDKGEETTDVAEPPEIWVGQDVEVGPSSRQENKMWATIDPKRAVAVPGTYFGFFHGPGARTSSAPGPSEPELAPVPEPSLTRAAVVALLALLACLACISILVWS